MTTQEDNWNEMIDILAELEDDLKGNRRALRHLKTLKQTINQIGQELKGMAEKMPKKKWI